MASTRFQRRLRGLWLVYGAALLLWLSLEDNGVLAVTVLGCIGAGLGVAALLSRYVALSLATWRGRVIALASGALGGGSAAVLITLLMFFKTAWHGHVYPDYPPAMMGAMLARAPVWSAAGLLVALAVLLLRIALQDVISSPSRPL